MRIRGLKPTLKQSLVIQNNGFDHTQWLVKKCLPDHLEIVNRVNGQIEKAPYKAAVTK